MEGSVQTQERPETPLRARRKALNLTQSELAEKAGCDQTTISDIEVGRARPSLKLAQAIAAALKCTLNDLFAEAPT